MHADTSFASSNATGLFGTLTRHGYNTGVFGKVTNDQQHILDALVAANSATYIDSLYDAWVQNPAAVPRASAIPGS